ncbi:hypothetical protein [Streptomyces sp. NRRL F-5053]|uniref:hypothetical protein n=1 Tax=Streptomyces sp. NRRL F-5053 TaxID=1463854 RepID=UPI0013316F43|nr:hypothetical protein [Streptomyces sp. NRRL F-5053]
MVGELTVELAVLVEAVGDCDTKTASELGAEVLQLVIRAEAEEITVQLVEQDGPPGPDGFGPSWDLPLFVAIGACVTGHEHHSGARV